MQVKISIAVLLMWSTFTSDSYAASVYKCKEDGAIVFKQMPCESEDESNQKLNYQAPQNVVSTVSTASAQTVSAQSNNTSIYLLERNRARTQNNIKRLHEQLTKELEGIKEKGLTAGVNRAGESYLTLLAKQIETTQSKYQKKIQKEEKILAKINQDIMRLSQ